MTKATNIDRRPGSDQRPAAWRRTSTPNGEHQHQNGEHRHQNGEHRHQNGEHRHQNGEHRRYKEATVSTEVWQAEQFEQYRPQLKAVAYRMLGSVSEADDAVQEAWLRVSRADASEIENVGAWLRTIVARVALDMLRARRRRAETPLDVRVPDPVVDPAGGTDPEHEALLADSLGLALLVVLDTLTPPERLAFVLHDMFAVPFDEIATILERSPEATRQLASRARRRVGGRTAPPDAELPAQWEVIESFLAAARDGDFDDLVAVLDPDVTLRADGGGTGLSHHVRGAQKVARQARMFRLQQEGLTYQRVLINGLPGLVSLRDGKPFSIGAFTIRAGRIAELYFLVDPDRIARLDLTVIGS
jgi:RNA polymerase sigma factor (sigma-70 family)